MTLFRSLADWLERNPSEAKVIITKASQAARARIAAQQARRLADRKSTRLNSSHTEIYTLSLHDALPISGRLAGAQPERGQSHHHQGFAGRPGPDRGAAGAPAGRSEEHTSELQSHRDLHSFPT